MSYEQALQKAPGALKEALIHCEGRRARRRCDCTEILGPLQQFSAIQRS